MKIIVNSKPFDVRSHTLSDILTEVGFDSPAIATAVNGQFVPKKSRAETPINSGDQIEIVAPMQGG
ncbi:thiamine biosynthesis protein ThiS [Marivivens niveibacter]|uniref:Thiamine biosynthesis protein ThiS n=1 Tax=Marivivens niveibacter TaxID=1930667 RepID=A0A251WVS2_9RHOB|nr:sulfur carrier protein ThiS [Marivivens niveibacter]OUD08255.1 thiamine biosynthesis protein ThiS [Marivivens niveibacter]